MPDEAGADEDAELAPIDGAVFDGAENVDGGPDEEGGADTGSAPIPGAPCESAAECDDGLYCNGIETCEPASDGSGKVCGRGAAPACSREHPCLEERDLCDCSNPDADGDGDGAKGCEGNPTQQRDLEHYSDCDDGDDTRCGRFQELCDNRDLDEDCREWTFGERDQDGDGYVDHTCRNYDPAKRKYNGGDDCNDHNPSIHRKASEVCDYVDNNCNGFVDEKLLSDGTSEQINGGLREKLLPDEDGDRHGRAGADAVLACAITESDAYVPITEPQDCDDTNPDRYLGNAEICDGIDNDCDDKIDSDDQPLTPPHDFPGTKLTCDLGGWIIRPEDCPSRDVIWCDGDPIEQGCRTDATRLRSCRDCETKCLFACGQAGCDEIEQVSAGNEHVCVRTAEGNAACWGRGQSGRLGNDGTNSVSSPQQVVGGLPKLRQIASGDNHACAIAGDDNALFCWGSNLSGQLGNDDAVAVGDFSSRFVQVISGGMSTVTQSSSPYLSNVVSVDAALAHTCAVLGSGHLGCWGEQGHGRLANADLTPGPMETPLPAFNENYRFVNDAIAVALGDRHGCIVTKAQTVKCWGDNARGQLAFDPADVPASEVTLTVPGLRGVVAIAAGQVHTCALSDGRVYCWGDNARLQLGRPKDATEMSYVPQAVEGLANVTAVSSGRSHNCALGVDARLRCWGAANKGQLGSIQPTDAFAPVEVPMNDVKSVTLGSEFSCALNRDHVARCWGANDYGQYGNGQSNAGGAVATQVRWLSGSVP